MKSCVVCKEEKALTEFTPRKDSLDGYFRTCKVCRNNAAKKSYLENHERERKRLNEKQRRNADIAHAYVASYLLKNPCVDCGNSDIRVLEFDHLPKFKKSAGIGRMMNDGRPVERIQAEIDKCEVRCRNCHTIKTYERFGGSWHDRYLTS